MADHVHMMISISRKYVVSQVVRLTREATTVDPITIGPAAGHRDRRRSECF
jgi:REP element-mobilizing transposase RayT